MYITKVLRLMGIVIASLALVTMIVSANGNLLSSSFAQEEQNFTAEMTDKEEVVGVHSPKLGFEENIDSVNGTVKRSEMTNPAIEAGMVENQTVTTIKLNTTQFQQIDKSQFKKAPEFAQISGYINTPNNNSSPITLSSLKGKVVLVYIWTYTCINSIRPMPYIDDWNQKYSD